VVEWIHNKNEQDREVVEEWLEEEGQRSMFETHSDCFDNPQVVLVVELHSIGSNGCSYVQWLMKRNQNQHV
jgi:ribulose-5-phosphate 4-epimerase/fuculose-1-phosphate aldolase